MITTCPRCHQLYESLESQALHPERRCPRCAAVAELLTATDALNKHVAAAIERSRKSSEVRLRRDDLAAVLQRSVLAVGRAASL